MKRISLRINIFIMVFSIIFLNIYVLDFLSNSISINIHNSIYKKLELSNPTLWANNYNDEYNEDNAYVHYDSSTDFQYLAVEFSNPSGRYCIVKGVRYKYRSDGTGPYNMKIAYYSDDFNNESIQFWVDSTDYNIPYRSSPSWRTVYYHGPVYAIDDTPTILFSSDHPRFSCVLISCDTPSNGYSYFIDESGVFIETRYEWIVDLMYEEITNLTTLTSTTGDISGNDYLDAYFIYMEVGTTYNITLNRNSGTGILNMRLVEFEPLTVTNIKNNTAINYPKNISYNPSYTGNYVLLIEPNQHGTDFAHYTIMVEDINGGSDDNNTPDGKNTITPTEIRFIAAIILIIFLAVSMSYIVIKRIIHMKNQVPESIEPPPVLTGLPSQVSVVTEPPPFLTGFPRKIFISYSTKDSEYFQIPKIAEHLKNFPEIDEILYWEADSSANIVEYMEETLKKSNLFILFCSENALNSKAVKDEWQVAFQLRKKDLMKIIPIYVNEDHIPRLLLHLLNVRFNSENFNEFIETLYNEILRD